MRLPRLGRLRPLLLAGLMACGTPSGVDLGPDPDGGGALDQGTDAATPDPCEGLPLCDAVGSRCDGEVLLVCEDNGDGCLVETATDCAATANGFCDPEAAPPACDVDPCRGLPLCEVQGVQCAGDLRVACSVDANGCLVEAVTDCAAVDGGVCVAEGGAEPMCVTPADPCEGLADACPAEERRCDADTFVACAPDAFGCLVETGTVCPDAANPDSFCDDSGTAPICADGAECAGDDLCTVPGTACEGPVLLTCAPDPYGCLRETRSDCSAFPFGFCDDVSASPAVCDVAATDPCAGLTICSTEGRRCSADVLPVCEADAFGCLLETGTDCTTSDGVCLTDEPPRCALVPCPAARVALDCDSGTVAADTAVGGDFFSGNACDPARSYAGEEVAFQLTPAEDVRLTVTATADPATTEDFNLFVLQGIATPNTCDDTAPCLGQDVSVGPDGEVAVDLRAGSISYVLYDLVGAAAGPTTTLDLTVACEVPVCGDGDLGAFEACDDGGTAPDDGCSATCSIEMGYECSGTPSVCGRICSNGRLDGLEECDDGNADPDDGCDAMCRVEPGFECEGQPSVCVALCGNGTLDDGESCDDGNAVDGDGCTACAFDLAPGPALVLAGSIDTTDDSFDRREADCGTFGTNDVYYDVFAVNNPGAADEAVAVTATWLSGDGYLHVYDAPFDPRRPGVNCIIGDDDFGGTDQSFLTFTADAGQRYVIVASTFSDLDAIGAYTIDVAIACGDGELAVGEGCDDGNRTNGDGCADDCTAEAGYTCRGATCSVVSCGNSIVDVTESCDDGNSTTGDGCSSCAEEIESVSGGRVTLTGDISSSDALWDRLGETCVGGGTADHYFDEHHVVNETGSAQTVTLFGTWTGAGADGYLHVYRGSFDPTSPLTNCVTGDDDGPGGIADSEIVSQAIADGEELIIIASTFSELETIPSYTITVTTD
ncbi:MAG: DUF4215 domain-containing protein [Sandaracinaceae bacterium]